MLKPVWNVGQQKWPIVFVRIPISDENGREIKSKWPGNFALPVKLEVKILKKKREKINPGHPYGSFD